MKHPLLAMLHVAAFALAVTFAPAAQAVRLIRVGTGTGCNAATLQAAVDQINAGVGDYLVLVTRTISHTNIHTTITVNAARDVRIEGGYAACTGNQDSTNTVLDGSATNGAVITMNVATGGFVHLSRLTVRGGKGGDGGGIFFKGDGILEVKDSVITQNTATHGGGILARGTGNNAELVIGTNVYISNNTASGNGGGIYADQIEMSMVDPESILMLNHANNGYGGGLYIHSGPLDSYAYIGSGGPGTFGAIWGNTARYGGGVAIGGENSNHGTIRTAELRLFSTDADKRGKISGNSASVAGGAIYTKSSDGGLTSGTVWTVTKLWNAEIEGNSAPQGGAVYLEGNAINQFLFNVEKANSPWQPGALSCRAGTDCGRIVGNTTQDSAGQYTDGAILTKNDWGVFYFGLFNGASLPRGGIVVESNRGGRFFDGGSSTNESLYIRNALIDRNQFSKELIRSHWLLLHDTTIAANTIGAAQLLQGTGGGIEIKRSILWQPGLTTLQRNGGALTIDHVMASEINSIGGNFGCGSSICALEGDPRFVDPAHGDFSLRAHSSAIDMAPEIAGDDRDFYGKPRDVRLPIHVPYAGVRDLGAFERQSVTPLVLNGDFNYSDLRLWNWIAGAWDGTENTSGGSGSGSWKFSDPGTGPVSPTRFDVGEQCIPLPGPAHYRLNGWGKSVGTPQSGYDKTALVWELRRGSIGDFCGGAIAGGGELPLSSGGTWAQAAYPASFDATEADFYSGRLSLKLRLVAIHNAVPLRTYVWFDGITLDASPLVDTIFKNGFEP